MKRIFIGFLLLFLNLNLKLGIESQYILGIVPDFVGYGLMIDGINEMEILGEDFGNTRLLTKVMFIFSFFIWAFYLLGLESKYPIILEIFNSIALMVKIYLIYKIIDGFYLIENRHNVDLNTKGIKSNFDILVALEIISLIVTILGMGISNSIFSNVENIALNIISEYGDKLALVSGAVISLISILLCIENIRFLIKIHNAYKIYNDIDEDNL